MEEILSGSIEEILFTSEESGFTVAKLKRPRENVTIVGHFPLLRSGEILTCQGNWKHHPQFGRQFVVTKFELNLPKDLKGIQRYLESGVARGVGPVYAAKIVEAFGSATLEILDKEPDRLKEIDGLGEKRIGRIKESWSEQASIRSVMLFLRTHNIGLSLAQKIYRRYKDQAIEIIRQNPYQLARDIPGIGFKIADQIAQEFAFEKGSSLRIEAGVEYLLTSLSDEGHTCYPKAPFLEICGQFLQAPTDQITSSLEQLIKQERLHTRVLRIEGSDTDYLWSKKLFNIEQAISWELERLRRHPCSIRKIDDARALEWLQQKMNLQFAPEQSKAICLSLQEKIHIITGGPGTGKSTITKAILQLTEQLSSQIILAAPTGRAAKRLSEITRRKALTIHALLEMDFQNKGFKRCKENPLQADLIIIDEASMIDTYLMLSLLKAIPSHARLILIGDVDQLPSVGPGSILNDCIHSTTLATTRLKRIFRQGRGSKIVLNAHRINRGFFPDLSFDEKSDFHYIPAESPEDILRHLLLQLTTELPKTGWRIFEDVQVLAPMKRGLVGIEHLNHLLQEKLNPSTRSISRMGRSFKIGDKALQIRNNYQKMVFNGDIGRIIDICDEEEELIVQFDEKEAVYSFLELDELVLGYAVSIHKYQGSESPIILLPLHTSHFKLLMRNLLYTGITRGRKKVILIGSKRAIAMAVKNAEIQKRHTGLLHFLQETLPQTTIGPELLEEILEETEAHSSSPSLQE